MSAGKVSLCSENLRQNLILGFFDLLSCEEIMVRGIKFYSKKNISIETIDGIDTVERHFMTKELI